MAFRCVLAKLGNICVRSARRRLVENKPQKIWDDEKYQKLLSYRIEVQRLSDGSRCFLLPSDDCLPYAQPADDPNIMACAHLAVEEFNKQKDAKLQFVRAVKAYRQYDSWWHSDMYYYLTLEAVEAEVVKTYQAIVLEKENEDCPNKLELHVFGQVADDGSRSMMILYDDPTIYWTSDNRDDRSVEGILSSTREIEVALQTRKGYVLEDEILGSLQALPLQ
ncbi:PREDICTED: uncharacterized protein LOC101296880 [Fragaria vesca subsp. vesca]|uniref:uncharacterized protein LOC101296880 n=1 Tax=Fragaria vesca subsp. vesca TaxID=101020 RepID=UPI0002C32AB1|nr:PREDICTED: uncharacterized protein LOC101296880 [Fragaria vesca subsp. vesca]